MTLEERYRRNLRDHMNRIADDLSAGEVPDWPAYKKMTGVIEGLALAEREFLDLMEGSGESPEDA